jgi:hypothetical protein
MASALVSFRRLPVAFQATGFQPVVVDFPIPSNAFPSRYTIPIARHPGLLGTFLRDAYRYHQSPA